MKKLKVLPPMTCDPGCGDCCGIVPVTETEFQRVARYAREHAVEPLRQRITCPWFQQGSCAVYPARPLPCRLFGHTPGLACPRGHSAFVWEREIQRMMRANGKPVKLLHDVFPDFRNGMALDMFIDQIQQAAQLYARDMKFAGGV
ncbi:MAG: YkgJ family cysteine cluster protein [bacterium]